MSSANRLRDLHENGHQSPWLDTLSRAYLQDGTLQAWKTRGIRGVTSNPTIFQKAIAGSTLYDEELVRSISRHGDITAAYWDLVCTDIALAADLFRNIYDDSSGEDGYVSVEVSPALAYETQATIAAGQSLWKRLDRKNIMIKVPATDAGIEAFRQLIALGINVNVTLIFSLDSYARVLDAYMTGLEELAISDPLRVSEVASVASFFVSRVDTEIDQQLANIGSKEALSLRGCAAIAQAKLAYSHFLDVTGSDRWKHLQGLGAQCQRPLWASTSTKNPDYPDTLYVDGLIGPNSVNTLPEITATAFDDHGIVKRTVDIDVDRARSDWDSLKDVGVHRQEVAELLERQGVDAFQKSFDDLLIELTKKLDLIK
jgi:transaldolase